MTFYVRKFIYVCMVYCLQFLHHKKMSKTAGNQFSYFSEKMETELESQLNLLLNWLMLMDELIDLKS